jgi:lipocalin
MLNSRNCNLWILSRTFLNLNTPEQCKKLKKRSLYDVQAVSFVAKSGTGDNPA